MNLLLGKQEDFLNFLDEIKKEDRVGIISHTDLDGVASAVLLNEILKQKRKKVNFLAFINIKRDIFKDLIHSLKKKRITKIIMSDINLESDYQNYTELKKHFDIFVVDHHPSNLNGDNIIRTSTPDCAAFTLYQLAKNRFNLEKYRELVYAAMISEYSYKSEENFEFIRKDYPLLTREKIFESAPGELSKIISSALIYRRGKEKKIFKLIVKDKTAKAKKYQKVIEEEIENYTKECEKEAEFYPEKNLYFYYKTPKYNITSTVATKLSIKDRDKVFIFVSDIPEEKDFVKATSRDNSGKNDMNVLMKKGIAGLENANAGGHVEASAARFMKRDLEKFKANLLR